MATSLISMNNLIEFSEGDLFFHPVLTFFKSYVAYHMQYTQQKHDTISGRFRGNVIPQITYENDPISGKMRRQERITDIRYNISFADPGPFVGSRIKSASQMESWLKQMFGDSYERARPIIESKFGKDRKSTWPSIMQFAYHIRNGCFHGNRFNLQPNSISIDIPTMWRDCQIDYSANGKTVAIGFFLPADFITLLYDMQGSLK